MELYTCCVLPASRTL